MYTMANTTVSILRGSTTDEYGDCQDYDVPIATGVIAYITSPSQSPFRPIVLGSTIYMPGTIAPSVTREIICALPYGTDVTNEDRVLDETSQIEYEVLLVTQPGPVGGGGTYPDMQLTLRRVTTSQPA
jgi:hypothetical protein